MSTSYSAPSQAAEEKAAVLVKRYAPELQPVALRNAIGGSYIALQTGQVAATQYGVIVDGHPECCAHTFHLHLDSNIPLRERALTLYLWHKLYPARYRLKGQNYYGAKWGDGCFSKAVTEVQEAMHHIEQMNAEVTARIQQQHQLIIDRYRIVNLQTEATTQQQQININIDRYRNFFTYNI